MWKGGAQFRRCCEAKAPGTARHLPNREQEITFSPESLVRPTSALPKARRNSSSSARCTKNSASYRAAVRSNWRAPRKRSKDCRPTCPGYAANARMRTAAGGDRGGKQALKEALATERKRFADLEHETDRMRTLLNDGESRDREPARLPKPAGEDQQTASGRDLRLASQPSKTNPQTAMPDGPDTTATGHAGT